MSFLNLLAQNDFNGPGAGAAAALGIVPLLFSLIFVIIVLAGVWKTFDKAGKPGWAAIIPIYNYIIMLEIAGKPIWWVILFFIPCVNVIIGIIVLIDLAKAFGQGAGMGLLLIFLPFIGWPMLGFGSARYQGPPAGSM